MFRYVLEIAVAIVSYLSPIVRTISGLCFNNEEEREALYNKLVQKMYDSGRALEAATQLEIDAVIDPAETRSIILKALETA